MTAFDPSRTPLPAVPATRANARNSSTNGLPPLATAASLLPQVPTAVAITNALARARAIVGDAR